MTRVLAATPLGVAEAAALLRDGRLVAFGTETVYGLGGRADCAAAVAAIYAAKRRPAGNPLICHYADIAAAAADAVFEVDAIRLAEAFWPGPLTLVLPRQVGSGVVAAACAGQTIAVRVPDHAVALALLQAAGGAVAAPSANLSGRTSPTTAAHVLDGLGGRVDAVLDGGACAVGLESTVIGLSDGVARLLRPGGMAQARIEALIGPLVVGGVAAPGQGSHYAPVAPLRLAAEDCAAEEALLAFGGSVGTPGAVYQLSAERDLAEAAARLFAGLRWLDGEVCARGLHGIAAMAVPQTGLGAAINDRLTRAARSD